ncbi:MAG: WD40 repeat domain-containing protein [Bacteroidota bacterium]
MKWTGLLLLMVTNLLLVDAQTYYPDNSLRLQPVWSRVADALGEMGSVESAEFSPDGKHIVSGTKYDNSVVMWRTSDGMELWRQYAKAEIERVAWSPDNKYVASCSEDFLIQIWDAQTGDLVKNLQHSQGVDGLSWSNNRNWLVTGEEKLTTVENGKEVTRGWLRVYQMPEGKEIHKIDFGGTINEIMFSQDNRYMLAAGHGSVRVYEVETMKLLQTLVPDEFFKFVTADFTPDGQYIAAGGFGGNIFIWDWQKGKLIREMNYRGRKVESLTWHPSGDYLVTSGHGSFINFFRTSIVLDKSTKEPPVVAQVFANDGAEYIDFNADGSFLVSAHQDGIIRLWVFKGEDHNLNTKRHKWVSEQQRKAKN